MRFGLNAYTWQASSDSCVGRIDHISGIVSECGIQGIESEVCMLGSYVSEPAELNDLLDSRGVSLAAVCYVEDWLHDGETQDETLRAASVIDYISHFPGSLLQLCPRSGKDRAHLQERRQNAIGCINDVARRAADKGIACAVHPSSPPGSVFRTRDEYEILLNGIDSSVVGFVPDSGHIARGGMDPLETIRTYRSLVRHVHFKDISAPGDWAELGKGATDFPAITSYLAGTEYEGWIIVEDESVFAESDPDEATRRDAAYIRNNLLALTTSRQAHGP